MPIDLERRAATLRVRWGNETGSSRVSSAAGAAARRTHTSRTCISLCHGKLCWYYSLRFQIESKDRSFKSLLIKVPVLSTVFCNIW